MAFEDYIFKGFVYTYPDSAISLASRLNNFSEKRDNKKGILKSLTLKGLSYYTKGLYDKSIKYHRASLQIAEEINFDRGIASSNINLGIVYRVLGDQVKAIRHYEKGLEQYELIGNKSGMAKTLNNIGNIYADLGDEKAMDYYLKSISLHESIGDEVGLINPINNLGILFFENYDYQKAQEYYSRSLELSIRNNNKSGRAMCLNNLGELHEDKGDLDKALDYYNDCLQISNELGHNYGITQSYINIARILTKENRFKEAIKNCNQSYEKAKKMESVGLQEKACECLYEAYKGIGDGAMALEYHEQMLVLNDSLQTEETTKKLQQMEFAKQVLADSLLQVEKDLQVEMVHQAEVRKKDRNRNLAVGAGIFFLVLSGGFYSRWRYVRKSKAIIEKEKDRSENLLLNILPSEIAEELKLKGSVDAQDFDEVSVLFTDFKGFTTRSEKLSARELVEEINLCFEAFDHICGKFKIEKIKTIGDAYMAGGGLPVPSSDAVKNTVLAALEMQDFMEKRANEKKADNEVSFEMRVGIHTGPVVAGIVGVKKFQYDIWGDTVNTASRMESSGEVGKVNISQATYKVLKDDPQFKFKSRGKVRAKGKGEVEMYFVSRQGEVS
jgi:class 3 adenylate cyclase